MLQSWVAADAAMHAVVVTIRVNAETLDDDDNKNDNTPPVLYMAVLLLPVLILHNSDFPPLLKHRIFSHALKLHSCR